MCWQDARHGRVSNSLEMTEDAASRCGNDPAKGDLKPVVG